MSKNQETMKEIYESKLKLMEQEHKNKPKIEVKDV